MVIALRMTTAIDDIQTDYDVTGWLELCKQFTNNPEQLKFLVSTARYRAAVAGLGGGKTSLIVFDLVRHLLSPQYAGCRAILVAPTVPMLNRATLVTLREIISLLPPGVVVGENKSEKFIRFHNGSMLWWMHGMDPDAFRGPEIALLAIDEAALVPEAAAKNAFARVRQRGFVGRITCATTPRGTNNWVYRMFVSERDTSNCEFELFTWPTSQNPGIKSEYLSLLSQQFPPGSPIYRQEVLGEFVDFSGRIYNFSTHSENPPIRDFDRVIGGIDFGISDPTAVVIIAHNKNDDRFYLIDEFYERGINTMELIPIMQNLQSTYGVDMFYADPSDPNSISIMRSSGIRITPAKNSIIPGIRSVLSIENRFSVWEGCVNTIAELNSYCWRTDENGDVKTDVAPAPSLDHAMDAMRYAIFSGISAVPQRPQKISIGKNRKLRQF